MTVQDTVRFVTEPDIPESISRHFSVAVLAGTGRSTTFFIVAIGLRMSSRNSIVPRFSKAHAVVGYKISWGPTLNRTRVTPRIYQLQLTALVLTHHLGTNPFDLCIGAVGEEHQLFISEKQRGAGVACGGVDAFAILRVEW